MSSEDYDTKKDLEKIDSRSSAISANGGQEFNTGLRRQLKNRHIAMIRYVIRHVYMQLRWTYILTLLYYHSIGGG